MYVQVRQTGRYAGINILHKTDKTEAIYIRGLAWMGTDVHQLRSKPRKCLRNDKAFPHPPQQRHTSKQTHSLIDSLRQLKLKAATKRATKQRSKRTMAARTRTTPGESPRGDKSEIKSNSRCSPMRTNDDDDTDNGSFRVINRHEPLSVEV